MPTRYAKSFDDKVYVLGEFVDNTGWLQGIYITETAGKIVVAHDVVLDDNGDIDHWGSGNYYDSRLYISNASWLESLQSAINYFLDLEDKTYA